MEQQVQNYCGTLVFFVNGKKVADASVDPEWTLLNYLRNKLRLCGTKLGCGEGGCGACTVMVSKYDRANKKEIHFPVNACLAPVCAMHGLAVTTVEGIGSTKTKLHPVQERIAKAHGSQCGFCTPGMVMSMYTLLRQSPRPSLKEMEEAFQGNLCRCTGYRPIVEGFKTFIEDWEMSRSTNTANGTNGVCGMGDQCCQLKNGNAEKKDVGNSLFNPSEFKPYNSSQEAIFPPELKITDNYDIQDLKIQGPNVTWYRPTTLNQLLDLKCKYPNAKIVVGNTEIGVETKFKNLFYPILINPTQIEELTNIQESDKFIKVGASVTLSNLTDFLRCMMEKHPEDKTRIFKALLKMLHWFAGQQIRSVGTLGGNIMTGSPISDLVPILMATKAELEVKHKTKGLRIVILDKSFFVGYRKNVIEPNEVLMAIRIPFTTKNQYFEAFKQARRREDDIAIVNFAINITFKQDCTIIENINLAFGGISYKTVTAPITEKKLNSLAWNKKTLEESYMWLLEDLPLDPGAPGGMVQYRKSLCLSLFFKSFLIISDKLQRSLQHIKFDSVVSCELSNPKQKSSQYYTILPKNHEKHDHVYRPKVHLSAFKQATGEAVYCDDIPIFENEVFMAFVTSTKSHARIKSIDTTAALKLEGVCGISSAKDAKNNIFGAFGHDEKVYYDDIVTSQGQIICGIVAKDLRTAQKAAKLVKIDYEELQPVIVTIEDAIRHKSFLEERIEHIKGDFEGALKNAPHMLEGQCRMGGQEHFYFETQSCIVIPKKEDDEMEVIYSGQEPTEIQMAIAEVLDIDQNKIAVKVKRIGGGFGGKETKATMITVPVAVAAKTFNRPIRCMLERDEDMVITGGRHPFLMKYKVGFDKDGKILGADIHLFSNGGYSMDFSRAVMDRAIFTVDNGCLFPTLRVVGTICKTNIPSNTAFRGFGAPQAMFCSENIVQDIAEFLKVDRLKILENNLYSDGDITYYEQRLDNFTLDKCLDECLRNAGYYRRREEIEEFNRHNQYKKRGLAVVPTKHGIGFEPFFLNQASALVLVYTDGSVLLHHGGVEMGQGLHTKMIQIASTVLEIPMEKIHTSVIGTDTIPNTSPTAASTGSDLNGMAVLDACKTIKERIRPYKKKDPKGGWQTWVKNAYFDRVSLSATGFYKTKDLERCWETGKGRYYDYYTYGVACTEVEIDVLTGDHKVLRTDIVMDLGESLNPALDIGQIEGAFMQGYGLFVLEELLYSPTGTLYTRGPGTYKIPGFGDIPAEFNVSLLKGSSNPRAVYSSKAVGEPPLFLASSALFAIKDAIKSARAQNGILEHFSFDAPATAAKIRMACKDNITALVGELELTNFTPWNVTV